MKKIFLFVVLVIVFSSCNNVKDFEQTVNEVDTHEAFKIPITAYSDKYELFAEADPFVVGKVSNVLSHFSNLPNFTALEKGSVNIRLMVKGKEIKQTLDKPDRKGIYSFNIQPETLGKGKLIFNIKTENGEDQLIVEDISVFANQHDADHYGGNEDISTINTTVFTKEQSWKIEFATEPAKLEPFGQVIKTTAQIQSTQGDEVLVLAKTNGIVKLSTENVLEGNRVANGQLLFSISGSDFADNNSKVRFVEAQNNFEKAKSDYDRISELAKDKIVSERDLLNAKNDYDNAKVLYDNLNKNFSKSGQNIISPMNGFVTQLFIQNGQYVKSGQPIVSISQNKTLMLRAEVQQKYASILGKINSATIRTLYDNKTYSLEQLNGKVLSFGKSTSNDNYLIPINLEIDNKNSFIPGSFVELYLKTLSNTEALTIPNSAVIEEQGHFFVFIQITPELFEKRSVNLGATDGLKTEILKGISMGERIVSKGAILIKLAKASGTLDAHSGHVH